MQGLPTKPGKKGHFGVECASFHYKTREKWPFRGRRCRVFPVKPGKNGHFGVDYAGFPNKKPWKLAITVLLGVNSLRLIFIGFVWRSFSRLKSH